LAGLAPGVMVAHWNKTLAPRMDAGSPKGTMAVPVGETGTAVPVKTPWKIPHPAAPRKVRSMGEEVGRCTISLDTHLGEPYPPKGGVIDG